MPAASTPRGRTARTGKAPPVVDLAGLAPSLLERARQAGALKSADLKRAGVPASQVDAALALLAEQGLEPIKGGVRVPLREQVAAVVASRRLVRLAQLAKLVRGATARECQAAALALVEEGAASLVVRGTSELLASREVEVLAPAKLEALARAAKTLAALASRARKRPGRTLLLDDLREQLSELVPSPAPPQAAVPVAPAPPPPPDSERVLLAVRGALLPGRNLAFVPDVARALPDVPVAALQQQLLDLDRAGRIELRPESGLGRFSDEELALCPPGPQGTRLSWARLLGAAP